MTERQTGLDWALGRPTTHEKLTEDLSPVATAALERFVSAFEPVITRLIASDAEPVLAAYISGQPIKRALEFSLDELGGEEMLRKTLKHQFDSARTATRGRNFANRIPDAYVEAVERTMHDLLSRTFGLVRAELDFEALAAQRVEDQLREQDPRKGRR
jgi:hypothetical protein